MSLALKGHEVWKEIAPELTPADFNYPFVMEVAFLRLLSKMRRRAGVPFRVVSDHRPALRNAAAGGAKGSAHMQTPCRAVDLKVKNNLERFKVVEAAITHGIQRIGIYPAHEDNSGSVHIDASPTHPAPRIWTRY